MEFKHKISFGQAEKEGKKQSYTTFFYNADGKLIEKLNYKDDGSLDEKTVFLYNLKGELIKELEFSRYDDFKDSVVTSYIYNDSGKVIEYKRVYDTKIGSIRKYNYDSKGLLVEAMLLELNGEVKRRNTFKYDAKGNEIEESQFEGGSNGKWISKYSDDNKKIESEWYKEDGSLNSKYVFTYDGNGLLIESVGKAYPGERPYTKQVYRYDNSDRLVEREEFSYSEIGEPSEMRKYIYEY